MCRQFCLLGAFPDINSIHVYNDMHGLYGRAIDKQGVKVAELMLMTPGVLAGFFGGPAAASFGVKWLAERMTEPGVGAQLREISSFLCNERQSANMFVIIHVEPSKEGLCQNHEVLVTNKHVTRARQILPSCAIAALALGALKTR